MSRIMGYGSVNLLEEKPGLGEQLGGENLVYLVISIDDTVTQTAFDRKEFPELLQYSLNKYQKITGNRVGYAWPTPQEVWVCISLQQPLRHSATFANEIAKQLKRHMIFWLKGNNFRKYRSYHLFNLEAARDDVSEFEFVIVHTLQAESRITYEGKRYVAVCESTICEDGAIISCDICGYDNQKSLYSISEIEDFITGEKVPLNSRLYKRLKGAILKNLQRTVMPCYCIVEEKCHVSY